MTVKLNVPYYRVLTIADPAVASEFTITATGQGLWRVISVEFRLVTDANVASRAAMLVADDGTNIFFRTSGNAAQTASQTIDYGGFAGGAGGGIAAQIIRFPLGDQGIILEPGWRLRSSTNNIQVGDQYSSIAFLVEEFPNGPRTEWEPTVPRAEYERS